MAGICHETLTPSRVVDVRRRSVLVALIFGGVHRDFLLQAWPCVKRVFAAVCLPFPRQPARPLPVATRRCYATLNIDG